MTEKSHFAPSIGDTINITPPTELENAPSSISISRYREVEMPWAEIINERDRKKLNASPLRSSEIDDVSSLLKRAFEKQWARSGIEIRESVDIGLANARSIAGVEPEVAYLDPRSGDFTRAVDAFVLKHVRSDASPDTPRWFLAFDRQGRLVKPSVESEWDFTNRPMYDEFWLAVHTVALALPPNQKDFLYTEAEYVAGDADSIRLEFKIADDVRRLGAAMADHAFGKLNDTAFLEQMWGDEEATDAGVTDFMQFVENREIADNLIQELKIRAANIGLYLETENGRIVHSRREDGTPESKTLTAGELYVKSKRTIRWTTSHTRMVTRTRRGRSGRRRTYRYPVTDIHHHSDEVIIFTHMPQGKSSFQVYLEKLQAARPDSAFEVHVVSEGIEGFQTETGELLSDIMQRCVDDESYRRRCIVAIPKRREVVFGQSYDEGYYVFRNPLPSMIPVQFPEVKLLESLAFRLQWRGTELGQLVSTINLAPGEERSINIAKNFREVVSNSLSSSASRETAIGRSVDLTTEIENEATREFESKRTRARNAGAQFSYGGFGVNGSSSTNQTSSLRTFARRVSRVARKAAATYSEKVNRQVAIKQERQVEVNTSESSDIQIENRNQSVSMNLLFYQVNNQFNSGLFLEDLKICITSPYELIQGSGIFDSRLFDIREIEEALTYLWPSQQFIPVPIYDDEAESEGMVAPNDSEKNINRFCDYWHALIDAFTSMLANEYEIVPGPNGTEDAHQETSSCGVCFENNDASIETLLSIENVKSILKAEGETQESPLTILYARQKQLQSLLENWS